MGLGTVGLGAAFTFTAMGNPVLAALSFVAALFHVMNHGLYKSLLFLGAGAVDQSAGHRDMNRLGGLLRTMPWTGALFLTGVLCIAALPPSNGFSSEWLLIQSLLRSVDLSAVGVRAVFALAGVLVALTAGLAVTAFVRAFAMSFLGVSRSEDARGAREAPPSMRWGMGILAGLCCALGILPTYAVAWISRVVASFGPAGAAGALVPPFFSSGLPPAFAAQFQRIGSHVGEGLLPAPGLVLMHRIGPGGTGVAFAMSPTYLTMIFVVLGLSVYLFTRVASRHRKQVRRRPWDGGRHRLWPEATYTATGFASPVRVLFQSVFRRTADDQELVENSFRIGIHRRHRESHVVDRIISGPVLRAARRVSDMLAAMHHGRVNLYVGYIFFVLVGALLLSHRW